MQPRLRIRPLHVPSQVPPASDIALIKPFQSTTDFVKVTPKLRVLKKKKTATSASAPQLTLSAWGSKQTMARQPEQQRVGITIQELFRRQLRRQSGKPNAVSDEADIIYSETSRTRPSVCVNSNAVAAPLPSSAAPVDRTRYITDTAHCVLSGQYDLRGCPWVFPSSPFKGIMPGVASANLNSTDVQHCVLRPTLFIWAPEKLHPGYRLPCPLCGNGTSQVAWERSRVAHSLTSQYMYLCAQHQCNQCSASTAGAKRKRVRMRFSADRADVMAHIQPRMKHQWPFGIGQGGRKKMFEVSMLDFVRAMATRASWPAMADTINEMKYATWARQVAEPYVSGTKLYF
jgi:hypothetical protein